MTDADPAEPDAVDGAPHPRLAPRVFGQDTAETTFLDAFTSGRLHHAWLLTGPRGVGKATLAWRLAAFLLAQPSAPGLFAAPVPNNADTDPASDLRRRMAALSEPRLMLLRRGHDDKTGRLRTEITVDEAKRLKGFFQMSAADGGRRVVIVDPVDEMNVSAANALLKSLEEPPKASTFLLVCHQPSRLLPTIRSRCRTLRCPPLSPADLDAALAQGGIAAPGDGATLAALAAGSAGEAVRLVNLDGLALWDSLLALIAGAPEMDRGAALALAEGLAGRGAEPRFDLALNLIDLLLGRLARAGVAPGDNPLFSRISPGPEAARNWAGLAQDLSARTRHGKAVNLDPVSLMLDALLKIDALAGEVALR